MLDSRDGLLAPALVPHPALYEKRAHNSLAISGAVTSCKTYKIWTNAAGPIAGSAGIGPLEKSSMLPLQRKPQKVRCLFRKPLLKYAA